MQFAITNVSAITMVQTKRTIIANNYMINLKHEDIYVEKTVIECRLFLEPQIDY